MAARRPDDIERNELITARWLNDVKNFPPGRIIGGAGILVTQQGNDLVIEASRRGPRNQAVSRIIPVTLTSDGGSAGNQSTQCSFTYAASDLGGNSLDTAITPSHQRPPVGTMLAATRGYGHYDSSGNFLIWISDEMLDTGACS